MKDLHSEFQMACGDPLYPGQGKAERERLRYMLQMQQADSVPGLGWSGMAQADPFPEPDWEGMRPAPSRQMVVWTVDIEPETNWGKCKKILRKILLRWL